MQPYNTYKDFRKSLNEGRTSCRQTVEEFLEKIKQREGLNVFLEVFSDSALSQADHVDKKIKEGKAGSLAGMVIAIKDTICYAGHKVSASSRILEGFESLYSSTAVERLLAEDAIIIGRTNCDEFAMGSSNENSAYGPVLNPLDESRVPGGSSGGSAAVVAAGLCHAALGSDTGGSIRQPASFCGVVGFRPTYGRVSRHGLVAFASSLDQIGPVTTNMYDTALIMEAIAGKDEYDATVSNREVPRYTEVLEQKESYSVAFMQDAIESEGVDPEIRDRFLEIMNGLADAGTAIEAVTFPYGEMVLPVYYVLATAEASSNLARFAGMLYGRRSENANNLETTILKSRNEGFGAEVKRRIMLGTFVLSEGFYDEYYSKAQKVRRLITDYSNEQLKKNNFLLIPTAPTIAFKFGEKTDDPISMYLADIFTIQSALAGLPSISLPLGIHSSGMPFGIQVIGRAFEDDKLLAFSEELMKRFKINTQYEAN